MKVNEPSVVAEVREVFDRYEAALLANDNATLLGMFFMDEATVRYGVAEVQHGYDEVAAFRSGQAPFARTLSETRITACGNDCAVASTLFRRPDMPGQIGRQTQVWVRTEDGWKIAAAHVSMMEGGV